MSEEEGDEEGWREAVDYEVLEPRDVDDDPAPLRPIGPGDVFADIELHTSPSRSAVT